MRLNALLMILVQEGTADISVDYIPYKIEKEYVYNLDADSYHTGIESEQRFERAFVDRVQIFSGWIYYPGREKKNSMVHYMQIRKNPCAAMSAEETEHISGQFSILREKMKLRTHFFLQKGGSPKRLSRFLYRVG